MLITWIEKVYYNGERGVWERSTGNGKVKKETKQTTGNWATDRVRVHVRFCSSFSQKKAMIIPSIRWLA